MMKSTQRTRTSVALLFGLGLLIIAPGSAQSPTPAAKTTYLVVVRPGSAFLPGKPLAEQNLKEHGRYMLSLYTKGTLKFAGGFLDDSGGAYVIEASDAAEANTIAAADPAVINKTFLADVRPWRLVNWEALAKRVQSPN
jgi:uncharacterized protein YciI